MKRKRRARPVGETARGGPRKKHGARPTCPPDLLARFPPICVSATRPDGVDVGPAIRTLYERHGVPLDALRAAADAIDDAVLASRTILTHRPGLSGNERATLVAFQETVLAPIVRKRQASPPSPPSPLAMRLGQIVVGRLATGPEIIGVDRELFAASAFAGRVIVASEDEAVAIRPELQAVADYRRAAATLRQSEQLGDAEALDRQAARLPVGLAPGRPHDHFSLSSVLARRLTRLGFTPTCREFFLNYARGRALPTTT